jgi:hypothetical protein
VTYYINGSLLEAKVATINTTNALTAPTVGINVFAGNTYYMNGRFNSFRMYNRALTAQEVSQNFNVLRSRYGL